MASRLVDTAIEERLACWAPPSLVAVYVSVAYTNSHVRRLRPTSASSAAALATWRTTPTSNSRTRRGPWPPCPPSTPHGPTSRPPGTARPRQGGWRPREPEPRSEYWGRVVQKCPGLRADGTPCAAIIRLTVLVPGMRPPASPSERPSRRLPAPWSRSSGRWQIQTRILAKPSLSRSGAWATLAARLTGGGQRGRTCGRPRLRAETIGKDARPWMAT